MTLNKKKYLLNVILALVFIAPYLPTDAHASLRRGFANRGIQVTDAEAQAAVELSQRTNIGVEKASKAIKRLKQVGVAAPTNDQKMAAAHLVDGLATENFSNLQLTNTVNLMTGVGGPPIAAPTLQQVNVGAAVPAGWPAIAGFVPNAQQIAAGNYLLNGAGGAGPAVIANFNRAQLDATVDLIAGHAGRAAIAAPTQAQVDAAVYLMTVIIPNIPNYTTAQLTNTVNVMTGNGGVANPAPPLAMVNNGFGGGAGGAGGGLPPNWPAIAGLVPNAQQIAAGNYLLNGAGGAGPAVIANFNRAQLDATVDLIAGHAGLAAIAAPTQAQVDAAVHLTGIPVANFTTAQLDATVDLIAGHAGLAPIPVPTQPQVDAAVHLTGIPVANFTTAQLDATIDLIAGHAGLVPIPAPTQAQVDAAVYLMTVIIPNIPNYTTAQLTNTVNVMTGNGGAANPAPPLAMVNNGFGGGGGGGAVVPGAGWPPAFVPGTAITAPQLAAGNYLLNGAGGAGPAVIANFTQAQLDATVELMNGNAAVPARAAIAAPSASQINAAAHLATIPVANFTAGTLQDTIDLMYWGPMGGAPDDRAIPNPTLEQITAKRDGSGIAVGASSPAGEPAKRPIASYYPQLIAWLDQNASENAGSGPVANIDPTKEPVQIGDPGYRLTQIFTRVGTNIGLPRGGGNSTLTHAEALTANALIQSRTAYIHANIAPVWNANGALAADVSPFPLHRALNPGNVFGGVPLPGAMLPAVNIQPYELERGAAMVIDAEDE